jgi:GntR family galactonate operon transcriptional repressor
MIFSGKSLSSRNLRDQLVETLGGEIVRGELRPGDVLPSEADLLHRFKVSRTVLREALQVLSAKGLVDARQRRGTVICDPVDWNQLDPMLLEWRRQPAASEQALQQLMEVRRIVEPPGAALAAVRAREPDRDRITAAYAGMRDADQDVGAFIRADVEFHTAILEAAGNQFLLPIVHAIRTTLGASLRITNMWPDENRQVSLPLHAAILHAVLAGDAPGAARAMELHLDDTERRRMAAGSRGTA